MLSGWHSAHVFALQNLPVLQVSCKRQWIRCRRQSRPPAPRLIPTSPLSLDLLLLMDNMAPSVVASRLLVKPFMGPSSLTRLSKFLLVLCGLPGCFGFIAKLGISCLGFRFASGFFLWLWRRTCRWFVVRPTGTENEPAVQ